MKYAENILLYMLGVNVLTLTLMGFKLLPRVKEDFRPQFLPVPLPFALITQTEVKTPAVVLMEGRAVLITVNGHQALMRHKENEGVCLD